MKSNQHRLDKFDDEIDASLKLLNETGPPAAMVSRIHARLKTAAAASGKAHHGQPAWVPASCAAIAAVLLVVFLSAHSPTRGKLIPAVEIAKTVRADSASPDRAMTRQALVPTESYRERRVPMRLAHSMAHRQHSGQRYAVNLFSYPPTQQEKLLVEFVRTARPEDLRDLNPEYQAKVEAQQEAEFDAYMNSGKSSGAQGTSEPANANQSTQE